MNDITADTLRPKYIQEKFFKARSVLQNAFIAGNMSSKYLLCVTTCIKSRSTGHQLPPIFHWQSRDIAL